MAWQLIYTSAPRSLEAGRSGFGTVARHRAISPLLVAAIERSSQFSRLPGVDTGRVIYSYRIIPIAGGRFHVLSSIRDAGADYTGRTNHIAHHLVAEPREISQFGAKTDPSPADVLLGMRWATSWTELPRYLEAADEIPLAGFGPMIHGSPWERIAGSENQAWLLASGEGSRGAYVIQPSGVDLREVFGESLRLIPERLWQIAFTTSLQPSDEPADFRWIGIEEQSPMRAQTETSRRLTLDLNKPLPLVELIQSAAISSEAPEPSAPSMPSPVLTPERGRMTSPDTKAILSPSPPPPPGSRPVQPASNAGSFRAPGGRGRHTHWIIGGAAAAIVVIVSFLFFSIGRPSYVKYQHRKEVGVSLDRKLGSSASMQGGFGQRLKDDLNEELRRADTIEAMDVVDAIAESASHLLMTAYGADFDAMRHDQPDQALRQRAAKATVNIPEGVNDLERSLKEIAEIHRRLEELKPAPQDYNGDLKSAFDSIRKLRAEAALESQAKNLTPDISKPEIFRVITQRLNQLADLQQIKSIIALLREAPAGRLKPDPSIEWFENALKEIDQPAPDPETEKLLSAARKWLAEWKFIDTPDPHPSTTERDKRAQEGEQSPSWPDWLKAKFANKDAKKPPGGIAETESIERVDATPGKIAVDHAEKPAIPSHVPIYFLAGKESLMTFRIEELGPNLKYFLQPKLNDRSVELSDGNHSGNLRQLPGDDQATFTVDGQNKAIRLAKGAGSLNPSFTLLAKDSKDTEAFRIYVGFGRDDHPIFDSMAGGVKREGDELVIDLTKLPGVTSQPLSLRLPINFGMNGTTKNAILEVREQRCNIRKFVQEIRDRLPKVSGNAGPVEATSEDAEDKLILAEVRKLSETPKTKGEKKGDKSDNAGDVLADAELHRPAEMLAVLFENFWEPWTTVTPNPAKKIREELAKKPEQADWSALLTALKGDFQYATSDWIGKPNHDKHFEWARHAEALSSSVCALEAKRQAAQKNAAGVQARAAQAAKDAEKLTAHPLLNGQIPSGVYTLLVGDGDRKLPLIDFKIP